MKKSTIALIVCWALFFTLIGPFLISARDTLLLSAGIAIFIGLIYWTTKAATKTTKRETENEDN